MKKVIFQFIALLLGIVYFDQELCQKCVTNINGILFLVIIQMTFQNMFAVVNVICLELPIFLREHYNGMYRVPIYFMTKQFADIPIFVVAPAIFTAILYWMAGLNESFDRFLVCTAAVVVLTQVVVTFGKGGNFGLHKACVDFTQTYSLIYIEVHIY